MQFIGCHNGKLLNLGELAGAKRAGDGFSTGLAEVDALLPQRRLARAAVHELLTGPQEEPPLLFALLLARAAAGTGDSIDAGAVVWSDPHRRLNPSALANLGISLQRLFLLHPQSPEEETWAIAECLRCPGVRAIIAAPTRLGKIETRRLQLAAEQGGGIGLLLRTTGRGATHYAAATRWLIRPIPGERTIQRWNIELIHGHGGRLGQAVTLEYCRETHLVRASEQLLDRPTLPKKARLSA